MDRTPERPLPIWEDKKFQEQCVKEQEAEWGTGVKYDPKCLAYAYAHNLTAVPSHLNFLKP